MIRPTVVCSRSAIFSCRNLLKAESQPAWSWQILHNAIKFTRRSSRVPPPHPRVLKQWCGSSGHTRRPQCSQPGVR